MESMTDFRIYKGTTATDIKTENLLAFARHGTTVADWPTQEHQIMEAVARYAGAPIQYIVTAAFCADDCTSSECTEYLLMEVRSVQSGFEFIRRETGVVDEFGEPDWVIIGRSIAEVEFQNSNFRVIRGE
jgi:hypothetical protein